MSLRVVVRCAVIDDEGRVLLTLRDGRTGWDLPGRQVDGREYLDDAATSQVIEETGVIPRIDQIAGVYFWEGRRQVGILFTAFPLGGKPAMGVSPTRESRYFPATELPDNQAWPILTMDALAGTRHKPRVIALTPEERKRLKRARRWRWLKTALWGKRAPRIPRFEVRAVGVIWDEAHQRVLTLSGGRTRVLPRILCRGVLAPWEELADVLVSVYGIKAAFRWVGAWQNVEQRDLELVFAATVRETPQPVGETEWSLARTVGLGDRDAQYVARVRRTYARDPAWLLGRETTAQAGDIILIDRERKR